MGILDNVKVSTPEAKPKKEPKVYHLVWDRKDKDGKPHPLSQLMAQGMTRVYGQKIDPLNINTGAAKAFIEGLLREALKK